MIPLQKQLADACRDYLEDVGLEVDFRSSYSGRGMYGRQCVGITGRDRDCRELIAKVICGMREDLKSVQLGSSEEENDRVFDEAVGILLNYDWDSMGMGGVILYWPQLEVLPEEMMRDDRDEDDGQPSEHQEWQDFDPDC